MASNQIQMGVNFRKNINTKSAANGKYYAEVDRQKTLTTRGLAAHLKEHNTCQIYSRILRNVLRQQEAVKERLYDGELAFRQLTVAVPTDDAPCHTVGDAKELPDAMGCLSREFHRGIS